MTRFEKFIYVFCLAVVAIVFGCAMASALLGQEIPAQRAPLGITPTGERIELGRKLFFDPRLSQDGSVSCSTCHDPNRGWSDGQPVAIGIRGASGTRNSPTIVNATYNDLVFWDGRTIGTTTQALLPLVNPIEMGIQQEGDILRRLRLIPGYVALFAQAFPSSSYDRVTGSPITGANLGLAISSFESTVVSFNAPIDRYLAGDKQALSPDALVGYRIFLAAQCSQCHPAPLYTTRGFANNGMEFATRGRIVDRGRAVVTNRNADAGKFKVPSLREIRRTAPYGHNGAMGDLSRVVRHYNTGGFVRIGNGQLVRDPQIDPRIHRHALSESQEAYLVAFLEEGFSSPEYPLIEAPQLPR